MKEKVGAIQVAKRFYMAYLVEKNLDHVLPLLNHDVTLLGTGQDEYCFCYDDVVEFIRHAIQGEDTFEVLFLSERESPLSQDFVRVFLELQITRNGITVRPYGSLILKKTENGYLIASITTSIPLISQNPDQRFPAFSRGADLNQQIEANKQNLLDMIQNIPCGIVILTYNQQFEHPKLKYVSEYFYRLMGINLEKLEDNLQTKHYQGIAQEDIDRMVQKLKGRDYPFDTLIETFNYQHPKGENLWMAVSIKVHETSDGYTAYMMISDITNQKLLDYEKNKTNAILESVTGSIPGGISILEINSEGRLLEAVLINNGLSQLVGYSRAEIQQILMTDFYALIHPDDQVIFKSLIQNQGFQEENTSYTCRIRHKNGEYLWILMGIHIDREEDRKQLTIVYTDVTQQKKGEESLWELKESLSAVLDHADLHYWEYDPDHDCCIMGPRTAKMLKSDEILRDFPRSFLDAGYIYPDDHGDFIKLHQRIKAGASEADAKIRLKQQDESYTWQEVRYSVLLNIDGKPLRAFATTRKLDAYKELEERFTIAMRQAGLKTWVYDVAERRIDFQRDGKEQAYSEYNVPELYIEQDLIHPKDIELVRSMYEKLSLGEKSVHYNARWRKTSEDHYYSWLRTHYTLVSDSKGNPIRAIGTSHDISEQKMLEERYQDELIYGRVARENALVSFRLNLSKDEVIDCMSNSVLADDLKKHQSATALFRHVRNMTINEEDKKLVDQVIDREYLISQYYKGKNEFSVEYSRLFRNQTIRALRVHFSLIRNPDDEDILAFIYITDITESKITLDIINKAVVGDYDFIAYIDGKTDHFIVYCNEKSNTFLPPFQGDSFQDAFVSLIKNCVPEQEQERTLAAQSLTHVIEMLNQYPDFYVNFSAYLKDGTLSKKRLHYSYINGEEKKIFLSQTDITNLYEEEQRKNQELSIALAEAEQASLAKTSFLSRVSHDMRTPMNGIIGLCELMLSGNSLEGQSRSYLCQIRESAQYLLSLINDTLDMSRIESERMQLYPEVVDLKTYLENIFMSMQQCMEEKCINFTVSYEGDCKIHLLMDKIRVRQILLNLLSNAVKFTAVGGAIRFVLNTRRTGDNVTLTMSLEDNGIGISESFISKIFLPFEQEYSENTTPYNGTGLGLSIVKHLVELMNGHISVNSTKNQGTIFVIQINFPLVLSAIQEEIRPLSGNFHFVGREILLVEDHPINTLVATKILEQEGIIVTHAENGKMALEELLKKPEGYFDCILMDIRMPIMDGIEATRMIRALNRADAQEIPIIAMTANAFDHDVQQSLSSGMNAHLAKPIHSKQLYQVLQQFIH